MQTNDKATTEATESVAYGKYRIVATDGNLDPGSKFFVLQYDANAENGEAAREALGKYCQLISEHYPELARLLMADIIAEIEQELSNVF